MEGRLERGSPGSAELLAVLPESIPAFLSFTVLRGFGATHPLLALAERLQADFRVPMGPFSLFYDAEPEDSEDRERLEQAWQGAGILLGAVQSAATAFQHDELLQTLARRGGVPDLGRDLQSLVDLLTPLDPAELVRLTYTV